MKKRDAWKEQIRNILNRKAVCAAAAAVAIFVCLFTAFEFTVLKLEIEVPVLQVLTGEGSSIWMEEYQRGEMALDDSTENELLEDSEWSGYGSGGSKDVGESGVTESHVSDEELENGDTEADRGDDESRAAESHESGERLESGGTEVGRGDDESRAAESHESSERLESGDTEVGSAGGEGGATGKQGGSEGTENGNLDSSEGTESENSDTGLNRSENKENEASTETEANEEQPEFPYYIKVDRKQNCITIYTLDEAGEYTVPYKAMVCSTGLYNATPRGTFHLSDKYLWRELYGGVYGQYATRITGGVLFHSVPYYRKAKNTLCTDKYNKLGQQASLGCIRLTVEDAKWIAENCPSGTAVEIYESDEVGPLGKPEAVKIDTDSPNKGWDPTDPDENNPWHQLSDDE